MTKYYSHTQTGTVMIIISALAFAFGLWSISFQGGVTSLIILIIAILLAFLFPTMTVSVGSKEILVSLGAGIIKKRFEISEVTAAHKVKNPWYYGWGIRWFPGGWLYNVSGFNAVEIEMKSGAKYRIGTDEPEELQRAIQDNAGI